MIQHTENKVKVHSNFRRAILFFLLISAIVILNEVLMVNGALTDGLVAYYPFDADDDDATKQNHDGASTGSSLDLGTKKLGAGSWEFNASDDYTDVGDDADFTAPKTINCWFNGRTLDANERPMVTKWASTGAPRWGILAHSTLAGGNDTACAWGLTAEGAWLGINPSSISTNTWYMFTVIENGSVFNTFHNGVNQITRTLVEPTDNSNVLRFGEYSTTTGASGFDGNIDECGFWNRTLTQEEIDDLYNSGDGFAYPFAGDGDTPSATITTSGSADDEIGFLDFPDGKYRFNVSVASVNNSNFYDTLIYLNGTLNQSHYSVDYTTKKEYNITFINKEMAWNVTVFVNNTNASDTAEGLVYVDGINPDIDFIFPLNNSFHWIDIDAETLNLSVSMADTNLYTSNLSIYNGTERWWSTVVGFTGETSYTYNAMNNFENFSGKQLEFRVEVWDDHTKQNDINPISWYQSDNAIIIDNDISLSGNIKFGNNQKGQPYTTFVLSDDGSKYKFKVTFEETSLHQTMYLSTSEKLDYRPNSGYMGHFVYFPKYRWIDLQNPKIQSVVVTPLNDRNYFIDLTFKEPVDEMEFESLGDLNLRNESIYFNITEPFRIYAKDVITNASISNFSILVNNFTFNNTADGVAEINITTGYNLTNITTTDYLQNSTYINYSATPQNFTFYLTAENSLYLFIYDEQTDALIDNETITIDVINFNNVSYSYTTTTGSKFVSGFAPGDYEIRYRATGYNPRTYYTSIAGSTTQQLRLYLLNSTVASYITFSIEDETGNYLENATVSATRFYVGCNCYRVVEMDKANFQGEAIFSLEKYDTRYNFIVVYEGATVYSSTAGYKLTEDDYTMPVVLLGDTTRSYFGMNQDIATTLGYSNTTKLITFTVSDSSSTGLVKKYCIYVDQMYSLSDAGYYNICSNCVNGTSGSVTCNVSTYYTQKREILARGYVETNTTYSSYWTDVLSIVTDTSAFAITGTVGLFLTLLISSTLGFIGTLIGGLPLGIIGLDLGMAVSKIAGIFEIGIVGLFSIVAVSIIIIFLMGERS